MEVKIPTNAIIPNAIINMVIMVLNKLERTLPRAICIFSVIFIIVLFLIGVRRSAAREHPISKYDDNSNIFYAKFRQTSIVRYSIFLVRYSLMTPSSKVSQ